MTYSIENISLRIYEDLRKIFLYEIIKPKVPAFIKKDHTYFQNEWKVKFIFYLNFLNKLKKC